MEETPGTFNKKYLLRLFIAGSAPRSMWAVNNLTRLCSEYLDDYELQIIDLYQKPREAKEWQIVAVPTLEIAFPPPVRRVIGDMCDTAKIKAVLDINNDADD